MSIRSVLFCLPVRSLACSGKKVVMPMVRVTCDLCGKDFWKLQREIHRHNFCCQEYFYQWNSKRISRYNKAENSMNRPGGVLESRLKKRREMRDSGEGKTYLDAAAVFIIRRKPGSKTKSCMRFCTLLRWRE